MQALSSGGEIEQLVSRSRICAIGCHWLFAEQGDILHQLSGGQKAFQSTFFHTVCLQKLQISESFQNFSDLEQSIFLKGSKKLIPSAAHGQI